ncbi:MAG: polysaccharide biosynthesis/export family protein [Candidatus Acidiferrales bacterium]
MIVTVRWAMDWLRKPVFIALIFASLCIQATYGQSKDETTQQTNEKIRRLASLGKPTFTDIPIGSGDVIHIEVFDIPELSRDIRVSVTGDISFPLVHERIRAAGVSPFQLEQTIQEMLIENGLVTHPQVSVFVKEQNSQPVTIIGAVGRPMTYQLLRPTSLLELLANAGGISDNAGTVVLITRQTQKETVKPVSETSSDRSDSGAQTIKIQLQDLLETGDTAFNIQVYGGDVINVPPAGIVYVMGGGVTQPGGYVIQSHGEQITVLKAVALAHGLGGFAKPDDAVIYRMNPTTGVREAIPVHIKKIQKDTNEDVAMKSNDILFVPDSLAKKIAVKGAEALVTISTGVLIYRSGNY